MKDYAILTICVGEDYQRIAENTHPTLKNYAEKIDADFICISESNKTSPHWEKFIIYNLLNKYKRIIYIDSDVIIRDDCPNLFDVVPEDRLGAFNEAPFTANRDVAMTQVCTDYGVVLKNWNRKYYNTGVMVISRAHKYFFEKPEKEIFNFYEQSYLNMIFAQKQAPMFDLEYKFNRMSCMDSYTGEERFASYIIHYAGFPSLNFVINLIPQDLSKWKENPDYLYQKHILINVQGGLGDQVCAEPAIRYLKTNVYPEDDVIVKTHYPRLFDHIEDITVFEHSEFVAKPDTPYYFVESLPNPNKPLWMHISNLLSHTIDFASISLLRRILPNMDKTICLKTHLKHLSKVLDVVGIRELDKFVLVHPGRHWESKTFPTSWWQEVVDGLAEKVPVCLIGKEEQERGTVPIVVNSDVVDTRNLLDLDGLISLISVGKVLVSNDSAPVHIAGAFNNYILLIPSCKHWDHILPWRRDPSTGLVSQYYKAAYLCKKLTLNDCNSQPTCVHGSTAEGIIGDWLDYLPDPKQVVAETLKMYKKK